MASTTPPRVHLTEAFGTPGKAGDFPVAEAMADRILSLPLFSQITADQQERVVEVLRSAL
jgi:dTDP-4-amino-4,6-dideoxygalactose transaminase